jgi:hypothetical protein
VKCIRPFVSQSDRPEVRIKSDTPLSELTVRDLASLLAQVGGDNKDFWDGKDWQKDDFDSLDQVIQALSGLTARVAQLADQVEELRRRGQG